MKFFAWFNWLNRERLTLLVASFALIIGAISPWYRLPPEALTTFGADLSPTNVFRAITALFALASFALALWFSISRALRLAFWGWLVGTLLFPYFITTWSPTVSFLATAYYEQAERVSMNAGKNFPEVQSQWKQNISLDMSEPVMSIANLSIQDSRFFQISSWNKVLTNGFGYGNSFFSFIGRGWSFTVIGLTIGLIGLYLGLEKIKLNAFQSDMVRFLPFLGVLIGLLFFSMIWANVANHKLDTQFAKGEYQKVLIGSRALMAWYPPLRGDEAFLERMAKSGFYSSEPNPELISFVRGLEQYRLKNFEKAATYFQDALNVQPKFFMSRQYLTSALLNQGITYFNSTFPNKLNDRKPGGTVDIFDRSLQIFPQNIESLYILMVTRTVNGEFDLSAQTAKRIIDLDQYFQESNLSLMGQAYLHLAWKDYKLGDDNIASSWKRYRQSVDTSTWKQSPGVKE
jgi:tetratricopeptide (TPR) repeat protein